MEVVNEEEFMIQQEIMKRPVLQRDDLIESYGHHQLLIDIIALLELHYVDKSIDKFLLEHMLHLRGMYLIFEEASVPAVNPRSRNDPLFVSMHKLPDSSSTSTPTTPTRISNPSRQFWGFRKHPAQHDLSQTFKPTLDNTEKFDQANLNRIEDSLCLALSPTTYYIC